MLPFLTPSLLLSSSFYSSPSTPLLLLFFFYSSSPTSPSPSSPLLHLSKRRCSRVREGEQCITREGMEQMLILTRSLPLHVKRHLHNHLPFILHPLHFHFHLHLLHPLSTLLLPSTCVSVVMREVDGVTSPVCVESV